MLYLLRTIGVIISPVGPTMDTPELESRREDVEILTSDIFSTIPNTLTPMITNPD